MEVPEKTDMYLVKFNSLKAFQTPSSYAPLPPPPANTNPILIYHPRYYHFFSNKLYYKNQIYKIFSVFIDNNFI